ncbi:uncharacterized protein EV420DRAFT_1642408 [Desarmillaria tabescens]|uniref:Uncharacterized protein n=1 Tax=Armillaria tabescens TaxID=1929756 RepID=A0AA39KH23_ARMTA|nr:uncharacterized protein EV420DRAFT_1642408 [Desarmillaria tabescens]KAK0458698.1 hypothetical protein EV420DRAFT_1642408 [Desarmillaria tabescens]
MSTPALEDPLPNSPDHSLTQTSFDSSFTFAATLMPLVSPVKPEDAEQDESKDVERSWPISIALHTFSRHSSLKDRKERALQILKLGTKIGKGLCTVEHLSYNQYSKTFVEETSMMDYLLRHPVAAPTDDQEHIYRLNASSYRDFRALLATKCSMAMKSLQHFGYWDLVEPVWGLDIWLYLMANDFEIYALQYRIRVEQFLYMLDAVHDWEKLRTRVFLHKELLAAQHDADKAHVKEKDDVSISHAPASSKPSPKLKTPHSAVTDVASDWNLGGGKACNHWRRRSETK